METISIDEGPRLDSTETILSKPHMRRNSASFVHTARDGGGKHSHCSQRCGQHSQSGRISMDSLGIVASIACLIHCLSMPLIMSALPMLGLEFLHGHMAHHILAFFVVAFACFAVGPGYIRHRDANVLLFMLLGVSLVLVATFTCECWFPESYELPMITAGNLIVVGSHLRNQRLLGHKLCS